MVARYYNNLGGAIPWLCIVIAANRDVRDLSSIIGGAFAWTHVRQLVEISEQDAAQHLQLRLDRVRVAAA